MKDLSRRNFLKTTVFASAGAVIANHPLASYAIAKEATSEPTLKDKKVLFVWGGWKGHEPEQSIDVFVPWMKSEGADVIVSNTLDSYLDEDLMSSLDLVVQTWTMGKISNEQEKGLVKAVRNGVGLAGWHGGIGDSFRDNVEFQFMVGGQWVSHPGGIIDYKVKIIDHEDYVTKGISDFKMHSEQYYMHVDPNVKVLATTEFTGEHSSWIDGCVIPVVWKKYYGEGRVFYSSLGHVMADYNTPEVLLIAQRGIRWVAESKYHKKEKWRQPVYG